MEEIGWEKLCSVSQCETSIPPNEKNVTAIIPHGKKLALRCGNIGDKDAAGIAPVSAMDS